MDAWLLAHEEPDTLNDAIIQLASTLRGEFPVLQPYRAALLTELFVRAERQMEAEEMVQQALMWSEMNHEQFYLAELHRLDGLCMSMDEDAEPDEIVVYLARSLIKAQEQNAQVFRLRTGLSLCDLYEATGEPVNAPERLQTIVDALADDAAIPELQEVKNRLQQFV